MLRISEIKLNLEHAENDLHDAILAKLEISFIVTSRARRIWTKIASRTFFFPAII